MSNSIRNIFKSSADDVSLFADEEVKHANLICESKPKSRVPLIAINAPMESGKKEVVSRMAAKSWSCQTVLIITYCRSLAR